MHRARRLHPPVHQRPRVKAITKPHSCKTTIDSFVTQVPRGGRLMWKEGVQKVYLQTRTPPLKLSQPRTPEPMEGVRVRQSKQQHPATWLKKLRRVEAASY